MSEPVEPLVPPNCNVRELRYLPFEVIRFLQSDLVAIATPAEGWAAVQLWAKSWLSIPAASMTNNDRILARAAGCSLADWMLVREVALRGWRLATDGLIYHPVVAEKALEAWIERLGYRRRSALGNKARHGKEFDEQALNDAISDAVRLLARLNVKSAQTFEKLLQGSDGLPSGSEDGSLPDADGAKIDPKYKGKGKGKGKKKDKTSPDDDDFSDAEIADGFERWWEVYPRKVAKGAARKAYPRAVIKIARPDAIDFLEEVGLRYAAQEIDTDPKFIPHPATWLNAERWSDDPSARRTDDVGAEGDRPSGGAGNRRNDRRIEAMFGGAVEAINRRRGLEGQRPPDSDQPDAEESDAGDDPPD